MIDRGSRLSAVRLAGRHAACDVLALDAFNEDHFYENLDWLAANQADIKDRLARRALSPDEPGLYLYDVTSSYLEGTENHFGAFGYNRDGKRGHAFVVMLAYLLVRELAERWRDLDVTVQEGIDMLSTLCATQVIIKGKPGCNRIPKPARPLQRLLDAARVTLPEALPNKGVIAATRKKLTGRRRKR